MRTSDLQYFHREIPRIITKWLPAKDIPYLESEKERLTKKGWTSEVQSKKKYDKSIMYALVVLDEKLPIDSI
jgi:hypothetical protein